MLSTLSTASTVSTRSAVPFWVWPLNENFFPEGMSQRLRRLTPSGGANVKLATASILLSGEKASGPAFGSLDSLLPLLPSKGGRRQIGFALTESVQGDGAPARQD